MGHLVCGGTHFGSTHVVFGVCHSSRHYAILLFALPDQEPEENASGEPEGEPQVILELTQAEAITSVIELDGKGKIVKAGCCPLHMAGIIFGISNASLLNHNIREYLVLPPKTKPIQYLMTDDSSKKKSALKVGCRCSCLHGAWVVELGLMTGGTSSQTCSSAHLLTAGCLPTGGAPFDWLVSIAREGAECGYHATRECTKMPERTPILSTMRAGRARAEEGWAREDDGHAARGRQLGQATGAVPAARGRGQPLHRALPGAARCLVGAP